MEVCVTKMGSGFMLSIPKEFAKNLNIKTGSKLEIALRNDHLLISPVDETVSLLETVEKRNLETITHYITYRNLPDTNIGYDEIIGDEVW